jgi:hypothetical protein
LPTKNAIGSKEVPQTKEYFAKDPLDTRETRQRAKDFLTTPIKAVGVEIFSPESVPCEADGPDQEPSV